MCNSIFGAYKMLPLKWPLTTRHFPFLGRHLGFPVDDILSLNIAFRHRTIFRKSHKHTPLYISLFQRYAGKSDLGVILPPPSPLDIEALRNALFRRRHTDWRLAGEDPIYRATACNTTHGITKAFLSVCRSVRLSVSQTRGQWQDEINVPTFLYHMKERLS